MSWKNTTLKQFADLHEIRIKPDTDPAAAVLTTFEYLTGIDPMTVSARKLGRWSKLNAWLEEYPSNINQWLWCGGLYRIKLNPADLTGDEFTTIAAHAGSPIDNLPEIMATLCKPVLGGKKDWGERAAYFREHMTVWQAYGTAVFFYLLWNNLQAAGPDYFQA